MMKEIDFIPIGYKESSLGVIPKEWEVKPLDYFGEIYSGGTPNTEISEYWNGDISWCTPSDVTKLTTKYIWNTEVKITKKGLKESSAKLLPPQSVIVCTRATIGYSAISITDVCTNQGFKNIVPSKNVVPEWLYYIITYSKPRLVRLGCGSTFLEVSKKDFSKFKVATPLLAEQRKIAEILSTWDKAIEKQMQLIEKFELRKKGLMQQLLTGKKRLPGFSGEWKKIKAGLLFENSSIRSSKPEPLLSASQDKGVVPRDMLETRVTMPSGDLSTFKLVNIGDFVISLRSFEGGIEYSKYRGIVSPAYTVLKKKNDLNEIFYKLYFKSNEFIQRLAIAVIGIRDGKQISYSDFCYIKIPYPTLLEQSAIANVLSFCDNEILLAKQKLNKFQQQKKGVMQVLLTGKKRVKI